MTPGLRFVEIPPSRREESLAAAVLEGLSQPQKVLPSRFFYDTTGSRLFERITQLPEYYLTRCETDILSRRADEIVAHAGEYCQIVEFGSGSGEKTKLLLRAAIDRQGELEYVPIDISAEFLRASSQELLDHLKGLQITAYAGDYFDVMHALPFHEGARLFLFLGSTIGNFARQEAIEFLSCVREAMREHDRLLVGVDLKKSPTIIEPAYNDEDGVTEQFNKNVLSRINRELCGHFDLSLFDHQAPWVEERSRIEMRLVSTKAQTISIEGLDHAFSFAEGEYIHTENSHKWSLEAFGGMCAEAGLSLSQTWYDSKDWFSLNLLQAK